MAPGILPLVFWFWLVVGPALALTALSFRGERRRADYVRRRLAETPETLPPASVIVPVKGMDEGLEHAMYRLLREALLGSILVSVGHRSSLLEFHTQELTLMGDGKWRLSGL